MKPQRRPTRIELSSPLRLLLRGGAASCLLIASLSAAGVGPIGLGMATAAPASAAPEVAAAPACTAPPSTWPVAQRVEQLLMVSGQFSDLGASTSMAASGVGGFVLFGQPAAGSGSAIQSGIAGLDAAATSHGEVVPWMSTDEEGGPIARLSNVIGTLPSPRQMAAEWSPAQVQQVMTTHALAMRSLGMTMDLAPVLDTASPNNTIAGENYRSFSENGQTAAAYGLAYAAGLRAGGIVPVVKHFPGLGHATADTDSAPATDPPLSQLETDDLIPFESAAAASLPVVMVGHPMVPGLTGNVPASLSPAAYQFLHSNLGFAGVAMTDDLDAVAVSAAGYSQPAAAVRAVESGSDMAMIDADQWSATVSALTQAVSSGGLQLGQLDGSVSRILAAKGITVCSAVTFAPGSNGSLQELFAVGPGGRAFLDYEAPGGRWSGWVPLGGQGLLGPVTFAPGSNGSLQELFAVGPGGQVFLDYEVPGGAWSGWAPKGGQGLQAPVTFAPGSNGSVQELFAVGPGGQVFLDYEVPGGAWSGWVPKGGQGLFGPVTFAPGSNGSVQELFAVGSGGQVFLDYEAPGGAWSGWHPLGGQGLLGPVTYAPGSNGSVQELFAVGPGGQVFLDYEVPGGAWSGWAPKGGQGLQAPVTFAPGSNGSVQELFAVGPGGQVFLDYEVPGGAWSGWVPKGGQGLFGPVTFAPGSNGSVQELFAVGSGGQVFLDYEVPGGAWSGWHFMGIP